MSNRHRENIIRIFQTAIAAVNGRNRVRDFLKVGPLPEKVHMIAIGKAACAMAQGAQDSLDGRIIDGLVITKKGYAESLPWPVWEAGHPLVDETSLEAGQHLLTFVEGIPKESQVLVLISGGASALVEALPPAISLEQFQNINRWILASGLDINDYNRIRRRLSRLKGGRLAKLLFPRNVLCLAISDVPGDELRAIGSGPLTSDPDLRQPMRIPGLPEFIVEALSHMPLAPAPTDACFQKVKQIIIARLEDAKRAALEAAKTLNYRVEIETKFISGDVVKVGTTLGQITANTEPGLLRIWGGETTVRLPEFPGRGGRNQSLALAASLSLQGRENVWFLAAGTDGTDGATDDAGALVDGGTVMRGEVTGLDARQSLDQADAGTFLEASGDLIQTGPTGTNVMDIMLGLRVNSES